jgi:DMSO/TMAO reductase YedYZ molybdopterin-dependent catalytic subunit
MSDSPVSRGFRARRPAPPPDRVPPGQYLTEDFPVLSAGPTPEVDLARWSLAIQVGGRVAAKWSWAEFNALPQSELFVDIHCVTKWTKFDTRWNGVSFDTLLDAAGLDGPAGYVMLHCDGGYTTNVPTADLVGGKAMVATAFDGAPIEPDHGGPARMVVPHLYFWKSAKWLRRIRFMEEDVPGFWEELGYHMYGDPWREQRYTGD